MSNLLQKASIVTTPTAYGVGVLNSIKPAIPFGEELVVNGNFATDYTGWSTYGVTSVSNGIATIGASANSAIYQTILTQGRKYKITINVTSYNGVGTVEVCDNNGDIKYNVTSIGVQSFTFTQTHPTGEILFRGMSNAIFSLSSVSVVEVTDADFDFTRTSSATRVNPDYLIETVSINSDNLVQNGNFSELGSELVVNGDFATDSSWTKGSNWTISGGSATSDGVNATSNLSQVVTSFSGKTFLVEGNASNVSQGFAYVSLGGSDLQIVVNSSGAFKHYVTISSGNSTLFISGRNNFIGSIDNVSVKEVTDADFQFERTSSATRVNPDYLIETVSINSDNLVQNGDFSELGSDLITNGDFSVDGTLTSSSYTLGWWSPDSGLSISDGKLIITNGASVGGRAYGTNGVNSISFSV